MFTTISLRTLVKIWFFVLKEEFESKRLLSNVKSTNYKLHSLENAKRIGINLSGKISLNVTRKTKLTVMSDGATIIMIKC